VGWGRFSDGESRVFVFCLHFLSANWLDKESYSQSFLFLFSTASQSLSDSLRFVTLAIVRDQHCADVYNQEFRFFNPTNICVSGARGSSCGGDSGSGQHLTINGRLTLIGLVSYGSENCESGHPPVMTRVTSYLDWIAANTGIRLL
jgi:secreted trypsin-like serine protease